MRDVVDILNDRQHYDAHQDDEYPYPILPFPFLPKIFLNGNAAKRTKYVIRLAKSALWAYHFARSSLLGPGSSGGVITLPTLVGVTFRIGIFI